MRACCILALLLVAVSCLSAPRASAQNATLRGTVTAPTGQPLAFAVVTIPALDLQQFTNNQGKFFFSNIRPGTYQLSVRQLGYSVVNVEVNVGAGEIAEVPVKMARIVTTLAAMKVAAEWACDQPGRPARAGKEPLVEVFEQLEQNAVRLRLLSTQYPFDVITERRRTMQHRDGLETLETLDSIRSRSSVKARYEPGKVVQELQEYGKRREKVLQVPTLLDFADAKFQDNHCFLLAGIEENEGRKEIRVDFKPASKLKTPDVGGSVFLQPETFKLLRSEIELTRIPRDLQGLLRVHATTFFDEIVPGLPNVGEIIATSDFNPSSRSAPARAVERLLTLRVIFLKQVPVGDSTDVQVSRMPARR
ncbi:MAG: carboxypeptidase-like regulatory domain-containing protein [Gemmatimonadaceae bacterium]